MQLIHKSSIFLAVMLSGCALPPIVGIASTGASVGIWGATGKTTTDHVLSYVTDDDCITLRVFTDSRVCQDAVYKQEDVFEMRRQGLVR